MIREILIYPNPVLKKKSIEVTEFNEKLGNILDDMVETMDFKEGIGLAGIQVGIDKRILVLRVPDEQTGKNPEEATEIINPRIVEKSGEVIYSEGCLSVPDYYEDVKRFETIKLQYQNRMGEKIEKVFKGIYAIAIQHEMDHLDGILFVERLSYMKRKKFEKEMRNKNKKNRN